MPQLDKFTFAPQVFWLILGFFLFYFVILGTGLPRIYKILLFRKKKLESLYSDFVKLDREIVFVEESISATLLKSIGLLRGVNDTTLKLFESEAASLLSKTKKKNNSVYKLRLQRLKSLNSGLVARDYRFVYALQSQDFYKEISSLRSIILKD